MILLEIPVFISSGVGRGAQKFGIRIDVPLRHTARQFLGVGAALVVALLAATRAHGAAIDEPRREVRIYNSSGNELTVAIQGIPHTLAPSATLDFDLEARGLGALELPAGVVVVERLPLDDRDTEELHVLHAAGTAACSPTLLVRVPMMSCRFGTAEAQVEPVSGASYRWTVEGGTILSGDGTPSVLIGFGGASSALARVTVTQAGCASTGAAILNLRNPLNATVTIADGNVGTPARVSWTYNTTEPILTQLLHLPDQTAPVRLAPEVRSYLFTPATEGAKSVKLTAALYRIGARRRAVRSGTGPHASSCSFVEAQDDFRVRPRCTQPTAVVSGGGTSCDAETIRARFQGTPPFTGRWSDGVPFSSAATEIARTITESGNYSIVEFSDAACAGSTSGEANVTIEPRTRLAAFSVSPQAIAIFSNATISYSFVNATSCRFTSATLGNPMSAQPSCSGTGSGSLTYVADNAAGNERITLEVTGPCGTDERPLSFIVCDYSASVVANGPTTFCQGGSVSLSAEIVGSNAGPPYGRYRFYRCTDNQPAACQSHLEYTLVQDGSSPTYVARQFGRYRVVVEDRIGCPSVDEAGGVQVTVNTCP